MIVTKNNINIDPARDIGRDIACEIRVVSSSLSDLK